MDSGFTPGENNYQYHSAQWSRFLQRTSPAATVPSSATSLPPTPATAAEYFPELLQQQLSISQAQLAQYSKLISPGRNTRIQPSPLHPVVSTPHIEAVRGESQSPRSRAGIVQEKHKKTETQGAGHGNNKKEAKHIGTGERSAPANMDRRPDRRKTMVLTTDALASRPGIRQASSNLSTQSISVPSTPHQRHRQYSFGSREASPTGPVNHSPRSAYSESNSTLPSLQPLAPPRIGGCRFETAPQHGKRRMPYNIGSEQLEKAKPGSVKTKLLPEDEQTLSRGMQELYEQLLPTPSCEANRKKFILKLEKLLNNEWPGHNIKAHMFGSSGNLLCTDDSDVDICITTPWKGLKSVCKLAEVLARHGMEKVICVASAKVPIVKVWDPELCLACDMNVNNTLALENTRMIKTYVEIDPRVRPLAMIVKHWTRRRILNDAAFGGTLSSYTWICMIITFLQLRTPPLLPSLHQRPHQKLPAKDGGESAFADDVESLKAFGKNNKETLGELLFHFFRFYGHEFDYDKYVLSVRNGKLVDKVEKGWHITANNRLCVEEPFNTSRNLSNTADDTSVRGLHMEIRRACALIGEAELEECCEQYVYPKEEERIWSKAPPQPKPVLAAPLPPTRRGNQRGGRNSQSRNHGNGNRRASSGASGVGVENNPTNFNSAASGVPVPSQKEPWAHVQNVQTQLHNELYQKFSVLQAQETNLRMQLYQRSQAFALPYQAQAHAHAASHNHGGMNSTGQHSSDHHMNGPPLVDHPPLSAPLHPEFFYYPLPYPGAQHMYMSPSPTTYASSPVMTTATSELRRSLHRSSGNNGIPGAGVASIRSHSQPACRTGLGFTVPMNGAHQAHLRSNGATVDENLEPGCELDSPRDSESPPGSSLPKEYVGYYVKESPHPSARHPTIQQMVLANHTDANSRPRRLSTDQFPQAMILDRLRRTSRSPSPAGHSRAYSGGAFSAPLTSTPTCAVQSNLRSHETRGPMIVNGSNPLSALDEYRSSPANGIQHLDIAVPHDTFSRAEDLPSRESQQRGPSVVNGSGSSSGLANLSVHTSNVLPSAGMPVMPGTPTHSALNIELINSNRSSPNAHQRLARQLPASGMLPLDLTAPHESKREDAAHLSPVFETRSPSPSATRQFDVDAKSARDRQLDRPLHNGYPITTQKELTAVPFKGNGSTRSAKPEVGTTGQWQQAPLKKNKKGNLSSTKSTSDQAPKSGVERKGG